MIGQCITSLPLSKLADSPKGGRKLVLLLGTSASRKFPKRDFLPYPNLGTDPITCYLVLSCSSIGFIRHFYQGVIIWFLEGLFNGNVATCRTAVTEVVKEKK
jgi:MFS family permease